MEEAGLVVDRSAGTEPRHATTTVHRTPIRAMDDRIIGYTATIGVGEPSATSAAELEAAYRNLDLANLAADRYVFLPATPAMLDGFVPPPAAPGRLVLDLPRGYESADDAVERLAVLRALGATLALVDYTGAPDQVVLLPHLSFVTIDVENPYLPTLVHQAHAAGVRVLAAGPDTPQATDTCRAAGVDGMRRDAADRRRDLAEVPAQRTAGTPARVLRAGEMQCLAIMNLLAQPETSICDVAQVIETDPVVTLRVLHLVNSGAYALSHQVDTVRQAIILLGRTEVWTLVAALSLDARPDAMDRLWAILTRAMACETLADDAAAYTVGMLSALATNLGIPVEVVLDKVGVSDVVAEAIRADAGPLGAVLRAVRGHEDADTSEVLAAGLMPGLVSSVYLSCLRDALSIARTVTRDPCF